jgi:hypothetical protein
MSNYKLTVEELAEMEAYDSVLRDITKQKEAALRLIFRQQRLVGPHTLEGDMLVGVGENMLAPLKEIL